MKNAHRTKFPWALQRATCGAARAAEGGGRRSCDGVDSEDVTF